MQGTCYRCYWYCRGEGVCAVNQEDLQVKGAADTCDKWEHWKAYPAVIFAVSCMDVHGTVRRRWPKALYKEFVRKDEDLQDWVADKADFQAGSASKACVNRYRIDQWQLAMNRTDCAICGIPFYSELGEAAHIIPRTKRNVKWLGKYFVDHHSNLLPVCGLHCNARALVREQSPEWEVHIEKVVAAMQVDEAVPPHTVTDPKTRKAWDVKR